MTNNANIIANLLPFSGEMFLYENFFTKEESNQYFDILLHEIAWQQDDIKVWNKIHKQPRLTAMYGNAGAHYAYSGIDMPATPWTNALKLIKDKVEGATGAIYNIALLNLYRDGNDKVGWHRDNEKGMGKTPTIASVSFGATRNFQVKVYNTVSQNKMTFPLSHGSLVLMKGEMQNVWSHQVPKTSKKVEARINITFRYMLDQ